MLEQVNRGSPSIASIEKGEFIMIHFSIKQITCRSYALNKNSLQHYCIKKTKIDRICWN